MPAPEVFFLLAEDWVGGGMKEVFEHYHRMIADRFQIESQNGFSLLLFIVRDSNG